MHFAFNEEFYFKRIFLALLNIFILSYLSHNISILPRIANNKIAIANYKIDYVNGAVSIPKIKSNHRPDAEFQVWAKCAKLTGLGQMCKVI